MESKDWLYSKDNKGISDELSALTSGGVQSRMRNELSL